MKFGKVVGVLGAVAALQIMAPAPATAQDDCLGASPDEYSGSGRTISLPGNPDINLYVSLCFYNDAGSYQAVEHVKWDSWGDVGTRFNHFYAVVAVQRNDVDKCTESFHPNVNGANEGTTSGSCSWRAANTSGMGGDGKIVYDIADDGEGEKVWQLPETS